MTGALTVHSGDFGPAGPLASRLLELPHVSDCAVLDRRSTDGESVIVAYVVPRAGAEVCDLRAEITAALAADAARVPLLVMVSALPLDDEGKIDAAALAALPVLDEQVVGAWRDELREVTPDAEVAIVASESRQRVLHALDLLPSGEHAAKVTRSSAPAANSDDNPDDDPDSAPPAYSKGEPERFPDGTPSRLADALRQAASTRPEHGVTYLAADGSETRQSYPELLESARHMAAVLRRGVTPRQPVLLQLGRNEDIILAFWACVLGGAVPVTMSATELGGSPETWRRKLTGTLERLPGAAVIADAATAPAVASAAAGTTVLGIEDLRRDEDDAGVEYSAAPDDTALYLLTSGSTGVPKLVTQSHRAIMYRTAAERQMIGFGPDDISLNWFPLDHVVPLLMFHIRDVCTGGRQVIAPTELVLADPLRWIDLIDRHRATITWAPNFAYALVGGADAEIARRDWDLSCVRFLINAGEAVVARQARRFLEVLAPHGLAADTMYPAWGMSETCSAVTYAGTFHEADVDQHVDVGAPIPGFELRVTGPDGQVLREGMTGNLEVSGACVTSGYHRAPEANAETFTPDGWLRTGDLGTISEGRLTITGRAKDVLIVNGVNFSSAEIEGVVDELPLVTASFTAAVPTRGPGDESDRLAVVCVPATPEPDDETLAKVVAAVQHAVTERLGIRPEHVIPVERDEIPKTAIGKLQRSKIRVRLDSGGFDTVIKRVGLLRGDANTQPDWFYRYAWQREEPREGAAPGPDGPRDGCVLLFADPHGLADALRDRLEADGQPCVEVVPGDRFAEVGSRRFTVVPGRRDHYRSLLRAIEAEHGTIARVLHLWGYGMSPGTPEDAQTIEDAQVIGPLSALLAVQALARHRDPAQPVRLEVVTSHAECVTGYEPVACHVAPLPGLAMALGEELPWLRTVHIDFDAPDSAAHLPLVERETSRLSGAVSSSGVKVAYRAGRRWTPALLPASPLDEPAPAVAGFRRGGRYLISGGLGAIGVRIADLLVRDYDAHLLLVGRSRLPAPDRWSAVLASGGRLAERICRRQGLEGDVRYETVDVTDREAVEEAVSRAEQDWGGALDGVIHLAGDVTPGSALDLSGDELLDTLRPKTLGTWALSTVLAARPGGVFVTFSSVNGLFGGSGVAAYASANAYQHAFGCRAGRPDDPFSVHDLAWSMWDGTGLSRDYDARDLSELRGFHAMAPAAALRSFLPAVRQGPGTVLVGLDGTNPHLRELVRVRPYGLEELVGYGVPAADGPVVHDRFGTPVPCRRTSAPAPVVASPDDGANPAAALSAAEAETAIADVWARTLDLATVGLDENFFDLGGSSLLVAQVLEGIRTALGLEVTRVEVFRYPTVRRLAARLAETAAPGADEEPDTGDVAGPYTTARQARARLVSRARIAGGESR
jgi:acyl-CoA synthetase (AMP-forming)/AMP-acid ligase II/NADP-dependent 3-hydroxy acid dehydrogenase YdfG